VYALTTETNESNSMPKVTFIEHDGTRHTVDAQAGKSLMRAAVDHGVPGIDADCGGECSCATCHVMLDERWFEQLGPPHELEEPMLGLNPDRRPNSRLSCQITVTDALDGIEVQLPEFQY
jgi:ferredoxin, 2Fe-2S